MVNLRDIKKRIGNVSIVEKMTQSMKAISSSRLALAKAKKYKNTKYFFTGYDVADRLFKIHKEYIGSGGHDSCLSTLFVDNTDYGINGGSSSVSASRGGMTSEAVLSSSGKKDETSNLSPKTLIIYIAADRGLCGAYNSNVLKELQKRVSELGKDNVILCPIGLRAVYFTKKLNGCRVINFAIPSDIKKINADDINLIAFSINSLLKKSEISRVEMISTYSVSALEQKLKRETILPIQGSVGNSEYHEAEYSQSSKDIINNVVTDSYLFEDTIYEILRGYLVVYIYDRFMGSMVAEYASRLTAMSNANDNCNSLKGDLKLEYNRTRQGMITKELIEIISGSESLS